MSETILTCPHMGLNTRFFAYLCHAMDCSYIIPPPSTARTAQLGRQLGREGFCQPLNNLMADMHGALSSGANAVIVSSGCGACRYPFYWVVQHTVLSEHFEDLDFYLVYHELPRESLEAIFTEVQGRLEEAKFSRAWRSLSRRLDSIHELTSLANRVRAQERVLGTTTRVYQEIVDQLLSDHSLHNRFAAEGKARLEAIERVERDDLIRVLLVGPAYEVLEPEANYSIEEYLARHGVVVERSMIYHDQIPFLLPDSALAYRQRDDELARYAAKYIHPSLARNGYGGYGRSTIGHAARARDLGFDGVVHVHSFSCMPEIVAKPILQRISEDQNIPLISLVVEEVSARELYYNRLEAFVDLIRSRKRDS